MGEEEYQEEASTEETEDIIDQLVNQNKQLQNKNIQQASDISNFANVNKESNLAQFQIDSADLLDRLEHFYKGEYLGLVEGNTVWITPDDNDQIPLNNFGVSAMMEIVSKYIDRNTVLSYYNEIRIFEILADLGDELILFILANYEKMGMTTHFKKTKYRLLVITTIHMIETTYRRSIGGKTLEEINQSRIITQSDILGRPMQVQPQRQKTGFLNKFRP